MYEKLLDLNNLYDSAKKCEKGVSWKESVQRYDSMILPNLLTLRKRLEDKSYVQKSFNEFDINERGKKRHIKSLHISDRVLQRALCDYILTPELNKYLIYDNGASIKDKGIDFTRRRVVTLLSRYYRKYGNIGYVLKIDFKNFFGSINHKKALEEISKVIKDEEVIKLLEYLMSTFSEDGNSLGIGSQLSQVIGTYFPTRIDNYCKIVKGCKYYVRYMDDIIIIHRDDNFLRDILKGIISISKDLSLCVNTRKTYITDLSKGFTFLKIKYIIKSSGKILQVPCNEIFIREQRKLKKFRIKYLNNEMSLDYILAQYKSWKGNLLKYDCKNKIYRMDNLFKQLYEKEVV